MCAAISRAKSTGSCSSTRRSGAARKNAYRRASGLSQRRDYKTRRLNREVACHYTFMHENLFDMNHQFMHRKNMGSIKARCIGRRHGEDWAEVEYTFSRNRRSSVDGEKVIVDLVRKRGEAKKDFSDHIGSAPTIRRREPARLGRPRHRRSDDGGQDPVLSVWLKLHTARRRAEDQPHVRLPVGEEAADPRPDPRGVAVRDLVHRAHLRGGQGHRGARTARVRRAGQRLEQRGVPRDPRPARRARAVRPLDGRVSRGGADADPTRQPSRTSACSRCLSFLRSSAVMPRHAFSASVRNLLLACRQAATRTLDVEPALLDPQRGLDLARQLVADRPAALDLAPHARADLQLFRERLFQALRRDAGAHPLFGKLLEQRDDVVATDDDEASHGGMRCVAVFAMRAKTLSHPLDAKVKSLYYSNESCAMNEFRGRIDPSRK